MDFTAKSSVICFAFLLAGAASLTACDSEPPGEGNREADIKALTQAKVVTWRALYYNQDADGLDAFLNNGFVLIGSKGKVSTKSQEVEFLRLNPWNGPDDFLYTIEGIIFTGRDGAVLYGQGTSTREDENGKPCAHSYSSSNTFKRVNGEWRPSLSHVSGGSCEPIPE